MGALDFNAHIERRLADGPFLRDRIEIHRRQMVQCMRLAQTYAGEAICAVETRAGGAALIDALECLEAATHEARDCISALAQIALCEGEG